MAPPTAPAGAPAPTKPGAGKRLPLWVWLAAGAVGLVVGFVFLRKRPPEAGAGEEDEGEIGSASKPAGGAVVQPLDEAMLEALGLSPAGPGYGGWSGGGGDGGGGGGGESATAEPSVSSQLSQLLGPAPTYTYQGAALGATPSSPTFQGTALGAGPRAPTTTTTTSSSRPTGVAA